MNLQEQQNDDNTPDESISKLKNNPLTQQETQEVELNELLLLSKTLENHKNNTQELPQHREG